MRYTKSRFIELCAQVFSCEMEKTYSQINMERALRGEQQFIIPVNKLNSKKLFPWLLGFVARNISVDDLTDYFIHGLKHNWFWRDSCDDFNELMRMFLFDILLKNNKVFSDVSEWYLDMYPGTMLAKDLITVLYGTGIGDIGIDKLIRLRKNENKSQK